MGHVDHADFDLFMEQIDPEQARIDEELFWHAYVEEEWRKGRELFLDNLPLSWCQNPAQMDGWLGMLPPEERDTAVEAVMDPAPVVDADEIPF